MDRISSLPDGVITHILSFLPIKEAALTSVLAKRWRILFAFSPNLHFFDNGRQCFIDFVDRVLSLSGHSPIKKFSLFCSQGVEPALMNRWLCDVLNHGVVDLDFALDTSSLPFQIFTCNTLVKLKLFGFTINELPENAFLPALQTLSLEGAVFYSLEACAFAKLLSACPVLEDLYVTYLNWEEWKWCRSVSSPSLQRLTIDRTMFDFFDVSDFGSITFDTPNLTYLHYSDFISGSYPVVNLHSLVQANLDFVVPRGQTWDISFAEEDDNITVNPTNLIKGLSNVGIMNLLSSDSVEMFYFFREAIPVYENLLHLSIRTYRDCCWRGLVYLLNNSPNLEVLTIEGPMRCDDYQRGSTVCECLSEYSFLVSCPVKVLRITKSEGTIEEMEHLQHFLGKFSSLELLEVTTSGASEEKSQLTKDLLMLPRASSKCKIKVN